MSATKRLIILLCCWVGVGCSQPTLSPAQFTEKFAAATKAASPTTKVLVKSELEVQLSRAEGNDSTAFLDNAYKAYLQYPSELDDVLRQYVSSSLESKADAAKTDRLQIVPIIKDRQWLSDTAESMKERGKTPLDNVFEKFNDELVIVYAEDSPKNIRYLTSKSLDETGVSRTELRALAISNLKRILPKVEIQKGPLVSMITAGGDYEACLLLLDDLWASDTIQVDGNIVVAIPSRDLLLVTGTKTPGGIAKLREIATKASQQASYRLTDALFVYQNGRFLPYGK